MEITEDGKKFIDQSLDLAESALFAVCRPLLMSGDGHYYAKNGNYLDPSNVLKEHQKMQEALDKIKVKLEAAISLIK